jgi:hypothetical protein
MLRCIALYLDQVELGRRVVRNGRDEKVTYFKLHFSTFLGTRKNGWMDFVEQATQQILLASQAPSTPQQKLPERRSFTAAQYATPENLTPLKPRQQIIEEARLKRTSVVER